MPSSHHGSAIEVEDVPTSETETRHCGVLTGDTDGDSTHLPECFDCLSEAETVLCVSEADTETSSMAPSCEMTPPYVSLTDPAEILASQPQHQPCVSVSKCTDVQVGPRLQYNAPVVINQFVTSTRHSLTQVALNQGIENADVVSSTSAKVLPATGSTPLLEELWSWRVLKLSLLVTAVILVVCVVLAVALTVTSSTKETSYSESPAFPPPPDDVDPNKILPGGHRIYSKKDWGGRPIKPSPDKPPFALAHPTPYVIVSHTAGGTCFDPELCSRICRNIQDDHMGRFQSEIAFNFLVGGDGNIYEGRGWDLTNARRGLNGLVTRKNIDICFIGNFVHDEPTSGQLEAATELLELGLRDGKLANDYKLFSHNDTDATLSPGEHIFKHIKDWPHYTLPSKIFTQMVRDNDTRS